MTLDQLFSKGVAWVMNTTEGRNVFPVLYKKYSGKSVCPTCPSDIYRAYFELKNKLKTNTMQVKPKYVMKPGVLIQMADGRDFSAANITDEIVEELLALNPVYAKYFDKVEEDVVEQTEPESIENIEEEN